MKQKDIVLIIVVSFISLVLALILSNVVLGGSSAKQQKAETVEVITDNFTEPDERYFNADAVNPTATIRIGDGSNTAPFKANSN